MSTVAVGRRTTPSTALQTYRTLVVDDVADLRQLYRRILERTGRFEIVGEAGDGNEALELAGRLQPDLVMLDVSMPDRDGMEILPDILHHAPGATVVMVSGFEARRLEPLALERGAVAYLEKGITLERFVGELLRALGSDPEGTVVPRSGRRSPGRRIDDQDITPEELLSFVAHEIRNPLSVVQGFADTLALDVEELGPDEIRHLCGRIAANARYLDGIVSSVLQLRAISQGDLLLERRILDPAELIPDLVEQLETEVPDVHLELHIAPDLPSMVADPARFRQVLTNLVGNAAKHSPAGGTVRIEAGPGGPTSWSRCRTRDPGSRRPTGSACSNGSSGSTGARPGSGSGCTSRAPSSRRWTGPSPSRTVRSGPDSPCGCPSTSPVPQPADVIGRRPQPGAAFGRTVAAPCGLGARRRASCPRDRRDRGDDAGRRMR